MKKIISASVGLLLLVTPIVASAATIEELQAQIAQLLVLIAQLKSQPGPHSPNAWCVNLSYNMGPDDTDADTNGEVTKLQKFLAEDPATYPEGRITGYFGPATTRAVQRWQKAHGLVSSGDPDSTGYGYVGPKTRAAMNCGGGTYEDDVVMKTVPEGSYEGDTVMNIVPCCKGDPGVGTAQPIGVPTISITPSWGSAPLNVSIVLAGLNLNGSVGPYALNFGDGSSVNYTTNSVGKDFVTHTYQSSGTYSLTLVARETWPPVAKASVTVGGGTVAAPNITMTSAKAAGNFEADGGGELMIYGSNFAPTGADPAIIQVFIGGIQAQVTAVTSTQVNIRVPSNLTAGQSYPLYIKTGYGTSNTVQIKILNGAGGGAGLSISFVSGNKAAYSPILEPGIHLALRGTELKDGSAATPGEGYNVQVYLTAVGDTANLEGTNAKFDSLAGNWEADLTTPNNVSKTYKVEASLYCSNSTMSCGQTYNNGNNGQVSTSFNFGLIYPND